MLALFSRIKSNTSLKVIYLQVLNHIRKNEMYERRK
jgi:hypothetical protein